MENWFWAWIKYPGRAITMHRSSDVCVWSWNTWAIHGVYWKRLLYGQPESAFSSYQRKMETCERGRWMSGTWMNKEKCSSEAGAHARCSLHRNKAHSTSCWDPSARAKLLRSRDQINLSGCELQLHNIIRLRGKVCVCAVTSSIRRVPGGKWTKKNRYTGGQLDLPDSRGSSVGCFSK